MSKKSNWIYGLLVLALIFSCNSPKRQKKINDRILFEKLKEPQGYLNSEELQRLERDFSLVFLDKYDFSGYDEEDTLASFVRSGPYLWIASCYLDDEDNPFFCMKEEKDQSFKMIRKGTIPSLNGECSYDLKQLLIPAGKYVFVSQRSSGNESCEDRPLIFHADGRPIKKEDDRLQLILKNCPFEDTEICCERSFKLEFHTPFLVIRTHENRFNRETEESIGTLDFDLRFLVKDRSLKFQDTIYK